MKKTHLILLSLLSGLLFWLSWAPIGFPFLIFGAFVPLFFISDELLKGKSRVPFWQGIVYSYPAFLVWNIGTTWWIWNSTPPGAVAAIVLNAFFMCLCFAFWHCFRNLRSATISQPIFFVALWLSWEFLHLHWDITWPWLNIGNVFVTCTPCIQWYEYTGTFGGTLWIIIMNFLLFFFIHHILEKRKKERFVYGVATLAVIIIPLVISLVIYQNYEIKKENGIEAVIVQQNTDPWEEQYMMANYEHVERIITTAQPLITSRTELLVCPETAIPHTFPLDMLLESDCSSEIYEVLGINLLDSLIAQFPNLNIIAGASTVSFYDNQVSSTARKNRQGIYYELYNTSLCYNRMGISGVYYKSRLVPGVEKMPYPKIFGFLEKFVIDLGGASGSLGKDSCQRAFLTLADGGTLRIGAPICYESVYGELFRNFIKDGAQVMTVITNDAWWGDTPGYKQHFLFSKLRAIETRRYILRSANTGISAFIDPKGEVIQPTSYETRIAIKDEVYPNDEITFYVKHGDYLARFAVVLNLLCFLFGSYLWARKKILKKI